MLKPHILDQGGVMGWGFWRYDITTAEMDSLRKGTKRKKWELLAEESEVLTMLSVTHMNKRGKNVSNHTFLSLHLKK